MQPQNSSVIDLSHLEIGEIKTVRIEARMSFYIPLPSIGVTNQHVDICSDLADAAWIAEQLAAVSASAEVEHDYSVQHRTGLRLTLDGPGPEVLDLLPKCIALLNGYEDDPAITEEFYSAVRDDIALFEEQIDDFPAKLPEIIDWYNANLVGGHYHQLRYDAPEYFQDQIKKYPERQLGFYRSAFSHVIGADCYTSPDSWLVPSSTELDSFFEITDQRYRRSDFIPASVSLLSGKACVIGDGLVAWFPMNQYFKSRVCASFAIQRNEDSFEDAFDWSDYSFTHSPFLTEISHGRFQAKEQICLIHQTGSMIILNDGSFSHILYDTKPLNPIEIKSLHNAASSVAEGLLSAIGIGGSFQPDWSTVDDEQFEQLAYDLIYALPQFDNTTIRKLGKSRSRDGGRDIEIYENPRPGGGRTGKWIFQCKLVTDGSSLTGRKLQDVGDMLEIYGAQGFGVITSAPMDATLYDKLDAICNKRHIQQRHFSCHELQRLLTSQPSLRRRYFPD